jgi:4-azaleucine resistance transporter AzlC
MPDPGPRPSTFRTGLFLSIPLILGYFPIAFSFGIAATRAGLSPAEAVMFSVVIFAGAAQFLALALVAGGAPLAVSAATLIVMNLRHLMYGPVLIEKAGDAAGTRHAWAWAWCLTDEVFAATLGALARGHRFSERLVGGVGLGAYLAWIAGTILGAATSEGALDALPAVDAGLGFMLPALFLALLLSILARGQIPTVLAAAVATVAGTLAFTPTVGILAGIGAGAALGAIRKAPK